jgi:phosphoenolpyruvate carboxykinase (ATP)
MDPVTQVDVRHPGAPEHELVALGFAKPRMRRQIFWSPVRFCLDDHAGATEPKATFSTCFGAPFLPLNPNVYASMLGERIGRHKAHVWLVNTGWTGGPYGVGHRMKIAHTRAMITAALTGQLTSVPYERHPVFNVDVPTTCPGVPDSVLNPRNTWPDAGTYDEQAQKLARMFVENFKTFEADVPASVVAAGPRA